MLPRQACARSGCGAASRAAGASALAPAAAPCPPAAAAPAAGRTKGSTCALSRRASCARASWARN
ncbi:MAG: hypothetical protein EBS11_16650 [Janthinobacterium sp.]|nr:hypothetical protein [Janthinobacterium sp.]